MVKQERIFANLRAFRLILALAVMIVLSIFLSPGANVAASESAAPLTSDGAVPMLPESHKFGAGHVLGFEPIADRPARATNAQQAGVYWTREDISWVNIETSPGVYNYTNVDDIVANANSAGLQILGQLDYTPQFYSSNPGSGTYYFWPTTTSAGLTAWSNFVTTMVNRYKGSIHHWQIWPNVDDRTFWMPGHPTTGVNEYKNLLATAYVAIKTADPGATVITAAMDPAFLDDLIDAGGAPYFDAVGVHNYTYPYAPETSQMLTRPVALMDIINRRAVGKTLWTTEFAWPTYPSDPLGVDEDTQAAYLIRAMLLQGADPTIRTAIWTDYQDESAGGGILDTFGMLLRLNDSNKSSYKAYQAMSTALGNVGFWRIEPFQNTSIQLVDNFEALPDYHVFPYTGTAGSYQTQSAIVYNGSYAGRLTYNFGGVTTPGAGILYSPKPNYSIPITGQPTRVKVRVRGDGSPPPYVAVFFTDTTGEQFEVIVGIAEGTAWREMVYYLDMPTDKSFLITSGSGNNDKIIDYPIKFNGVSLKIGDLGVHPGSGNVYIDNILFEYGPTVFDVVYGSAASGSVHAVWAVDGSPSIDVPVPDGVSSVSVRTWENTTYNLAASDGKVNVTASEHPVFVSVPQVNKVDTTGVFRPSNGWIYLKNKNETGFADQFQIYGIANDKPISGDWNGDGVDSIGIFRNGAFYLRNDPSACEVNCFADVIISFGIGSDWPVAGDWDDDGYDEVGIFRDGSFSLILSELDTSQILPAFGLGIPGDLPIAGDWDGDGDDTVGVFRPSNGWIYLKMNNTTGFADQFQIYGMANDWPMAGDWDGDGVDSIGVLRGNWFYLRNDPSACTTNCFADILFQLGNPGDMPIAGDWNGLP